MRVAIIGAGPAGLAAGEVLSRRDVQVEIFEASDTVGGMARSFALWGQTVDLGPHRFFSQDPTVNQFWLDVVGADVRMVDRLTRIFYRDRFFRYPLEARNALWNMGALEAARCVGSYLAQKVAPGISDGLEGTFEGWVVERFGRRLFEIFFQAYSEKLWGISCRDLDADFAAQRIKKFSLAAAIWSALGLGGGLHATLVDRFAYPTGGSGLVYERLAARIRERGGRVETRRPIRGFVHDHGVVRGLHFANGETRCFDHVISTMPLTQLVRGLGPLPALVAGAVEQLRFRNTILVYLNVDARDLFPDQWLYVHSPELRTGRVTNFRNWVPELHGDSPTSILALEYWCDDEDPLWTESEECLLARAAREIRSTGLIGSAAILDGKIVRVHRSYPVYRAGYQAHLDRVVAYLNRFEGLTPIGRGGSFKYNNQDHSLLMGLLAAENLLDGKHHRLWSVNTDYQTYQEAAEIAHAGRTHLGRRLIPAPVSPRENSGNTRKNSGGKYSGD
jgi:protoporphyrinogen oxidase